jgi:hypothetical protein
MIARLVKLFADPRGYWTEVIAEPGDLRRLLVPQMLILAAVPALALFLGQILVFAKGGFATAAMSAFLALVLCYALNLVIWIALGYVLDGLASSFGSQRDIGQAMKLATGTIIPVWLGGSLHLTGNPYLAAAGSLAGLAYGGYVLYLGLPIMNGTAQEKAVGYTAATLGILFVVTMLVFVVVSCPATCLIRPGLDRPSY